MPTARKVAQRISAGTVSVATLTSAYAVTALPVQSDMGIIEWAGPSARITTPVDFALVAPAMDQSLQGQGFKECDWVFSYFTFGMLAYWHSTFLPSGVKSAPVTIMHYDDDDVAVFMTCTLWRPKLPGDGDAAVGGWANIVWKLRAGTIIT